MTKRLSKIPNKVEFDEALIHHTKFLINSPCMVERVYCISKDIKKQPTCAEKNCKECLLFSEYTRGYGLYCSRNCSLTYANSLERTWENGMKGKKYTNEEKEHLSNVFKDKYKNKENHPWFGKKITEEQRKQRSESHLGLPSGNKGNKMSKDSKQLMRKAKLGKKQPQALIDNRVKSRAGYKHSEETKQKFRESYRKRAKEGKHYFTPKHNKVSQVYLKEFDSLNGLNGRYAENGGEFYIKALGYFPDYFNEDIKLIMEFDEEHHYYADGSLKPKDIQRQKEIQEFYPDFKFIRIKESDLIKELKFSVSNQVI